METTEIRALGGQLVPVKIRVSKRARRLRLSVDANSATVALVLPRRARRAEIDRFLDRHADWLLAQIDGLPPRIPFTDGAVIPVLGRNRRIRHLPLLPAQVRLEGGDVVVGGRGDQLAPRITEWLRAFARETLGQRAGEKAAALGREVSRVSVRDPRTRWGSCSAKGRLSFSWRLVLAPVAVLDYVVAHEVAHLREANHGPRFWALVERLCPDHEAARRWLADRGPALHRYG